MRLRTYIYALVTALLVALAITFVARERDQAHPASASTTQSTTLDIADQVAAVTYPREPILIPDASLPTYVVTPTPVPTLAAPIHSLVTAAEVAPPQPLPAYSDAYTACLSNPERYNWEYWALVAGFPEYVIHSPEMQTLIHTESGGDLCAINRSSGAICWIQQYPGSDVFLDPLRCMQQGYSKWAPTQSFYDHWYKFWGN